MANSNYPSELWINNDDPKLIKKLKSWPENIPETAVDALPLLAKVVIEM